MPRTSRSRQRRAYLGIGSNLGDRLAHLQSAVDGLARTPGITVAAVSPVYETEPVGGPEQPEYLNAVVGIDTDRTPRQLLDVAHSLEDAAERTRDVRWGPRTLDVDVLLVGEEEVDEDDLQVPHPRMRDRAFVMAPLADLDPSIAPKPSGGWTGGGGFADRRRRSRSSAEATSGAGVRRTDLSLTVS